MREQYVENLFELPLYVLGCCVRNQVASTDTAPDHPAHDHTVRWPVQVYSPRHATVDKAAAAKVAQPKNGPVAVHHGSEVDLCDWFVECKTRASSPCRNPDGIGVQIGHYALGQ